MPPPTTLLAGRQRDSESQFIVNQFQLVSSINTNIQLSTCSIKLAVWAAKTEPVSSLWQQSPFQMIIEEKWLLAISGSDLISEFLTLFTSKFLLDGHEESASFGQNDSLIKILVKIYVFAFSMIMAWSCQDVHLMILVIGRWHSVLYWDWNLRSVLLQNHGEMPISHRFVILLQTSKQISSS